MYHEKEYIHSKYYYSVLLLLPTQPSINPFSQIYIHPYIHPATHPSTHPFLHPSTVSLSTQTLTTVRLVQLDLPYLIAFWVQSVLQVDLRRVVSVRAELHGALLPVKWEIFHLDKRNGDVRRVRERGSELYEEMTGKNERVCVCRRSPQRHRSCSRVQGESR